MAYEKSVSAKQKRPTKSQEKWCVDCSLECPFRLPFCSTKVTKLIIFQFKLLHRPATNDFLRENNICFFWGTMKESLIHLFWTCSKTSKTSCFWQDFMKWLAQNQVMLKSNTLVPAIIIGLRLDTLFHTKQYFYFLVARY